MILLDSSLLIAFKVRNDIHHERADALMKRFVDPRYGKPLITDYIFDETVTGIFVRSKNLRLAVKYGRELLESLEMIEVDEMVFQDAWKIFSRQDYGKLSFTDATSVALMKNHAIKRIGTFDNDFQVIKGINAVG